MRYRIVASLLEGSKVIGYRVVGEDNSVKHFGTGDIIKLASNGLLVNARYIGGSLRGLGVDLNNMEAIQVTIKKEAKKESVQKTTSNNSNQVRALKRILDLDLKPIGYLVGNGRVEKFISDQEIVKYTNIHYDSKIPKQILCGDIFDKAIDNLHNAISVYRSAVIDNKIYYKPRVLRGGKREIEYECIEIDLRKRVCEYVMYRKMIKIDNLLDIDYFGDGYMKNVKGSIFEFYVNSDTGLRTVYLDVAKNKQVQNG